jgi:hypothetical protein
LVTLTTTEICVTFEPLFSIKRSSYFSASK